MTQEEKKNAPEKTRDLLIEYADPKRPKEIVTIPASWKVTFGPWSVRKSDQPMQHKHRPGWTLRLYEAKEQQRAVFTDVAAFRDLSIPLKRETIQLRLDGGDDTTPPQGNKWVTITVGDYQSTDYEPDVNESPFEMTIAEQVF